MTDLSLLQAWGMSAMAGICAGLVSGFVLHESQWINIKRDRDYHNLRQVLLALTDFRQKILGCTNEHRIYGYPLHEPAQRIRNHAYLLEIPKHQGLREDILTFIKEEKDLGRRIASMNGPARGDEEKRAKKRTDDLIVEVENTLRKPRKRNPKMRKK